MLSWMADKIRGYLGPSELTEPAPAELVAASMAEAFRTNPVRSFSSNPFSIGHLVVDWRGRRMRAEWFSTGTPYELTLDNERWPGGRGLASGIVAIARQRALGMADERMAELAREIGRGSAG